MSYKITVLKGDGIGPEVIGETLKVLDVISAKYDVDFEYKEGLIGGISIDTNGCPLTDETVAMCKDSDAVLLGAVGGPKWDKNENGNRPEVGLLKIRKDLNLYANIRPAVLIPALKDACPLREELSSQGIDIMVVRELTGGVYFGERGRRDTADGEEAFDTDKYNVMEVDRIAKVAYEFAMKRGKNLISIDKANVLENSRLWRERVELMGKDYPEVTQTNLLVDNAAMQLVKNPAQFDVVLANNMFGDILSDEAAQITGSIGILASSSMGEGSFGLYEPIHGSAPDIAGQDKANPIATILSAAMMLRYSLGENDAAKAIEDAVNLTLEQGFRTFDLSRENALTCSQMGNKICENIQ